MYTPRRAATATSCACLSRLISVPAGLYGSLMSRSFVCSRIAASVARGSICQPVDAESCTVVTWLPACTGASCVDWYAGSKTTACVCELVSACAAVARATCPPAKMRIFSALILGPYSWAISWRRSGLPPFGVYSSVWLLYASTRSVSPLARVNSTSSRCVSGCAYELDRLYGIPPEPCRVSCLCFFDHGSVSGIVRHSLRRQFKTCWRGSPADTFLLGLEF